MAAVKWPTWQQALIAALVSGAIALVLARRRREAEAASAPGAEAGADESSSVARLPEALATEFSLIAALYSIWRVARKLPLAQDEGAIERARSIVDLQEALYFPSELAVQNFILRNDWLGWPTTIYYATLHVPALVAFLFWLFIRHRDQYPHWRNGLVFLTGTCLVIRFWRVAPPRFLVDLGYQDLSEIFGPSIYGPVGTGVSDQFAAMPSIHVGWAAVVSFGVFAATTSRWRWVVLLHVIITVIIVSGTGNHWWLDGIVAIALLAIGLGLDTAIRRRLGTHPASDPHDAVTNNIPTNTPNPGSVSSSNPAQSGSDVSSVS